MSRFYKYYIDMLVSLAISIMLFPVFLFIALFVRLTMGNPVLFCQERPGLNGKPFVMYKFRTMKDLRDEKGDLLADKQRLTLIGRILRSTSLDELPELFNVLKGEMSLVGPRPLLMEYLDYYTPEQARRHKVKPGITGWAQVNGRNALTWEEKLELDIWYVDNWTVWLDIKIIFTTISKVLKREGISQEGQATMERFTGTVRAVETKE